MLTLPAQLNAYAGMLPADRLQDAALYLIPSILLAVLIRFLSRQHPAFFLLHLSGTICHEAAHFVAGLLTGAQPRSFSVIPRRTGNSWQLGVVMLGNVRWYNAAPAALAPLFIIVIPVAVALWRTQTGLHFVAWDIAVAFLLAPQFLSFLPSMEDWKIAVYSWPYLLIGGGLWWVVKNVHF